MIVLGIESSCDETAISVVRSGKRVMASLISSQIEVHQVFGGVVPEVAAREHLRAIAPMFNSAIAEAQISKSEIDLISVTQGPGLIGCLLVGVCFAKGLATSLKKPLIPVDHVHAHLHGAFLGIDEGVSDEELFPCLALVVSGGHTNLYYMKHRTSFNLFATTVDDACGECFDKVAKMLEFPYPGGPKIEGAAKSGKLGRYPMPRMVKEKSRLQFSYSGLKTHMLNLKRKNGGSFPGDSLNDVCAAFQHEALGQLIRKIQYATQAYPDCKSLVVAGGVAANQCFRDRLKQEVKIPSFFPRMEFCSDNAAMIASLGWYQYNASNYPEEFLGAHGWDAYSRYKFEEFVVAPKGAMKSKELERI